MALIDYNNGTATISVNGGQPPFSYLLKQGGVAATHDGANFVNPIVSSNQSVVFGDSSDLTGSYGMPSGTYTCEITDNNGCIVTTSEIVISQTEEATTTMATAATTMATAATTLATIPTTPATDATTLATAATTLATNATTEATNATTIATNATTIATNATTEATNATTLAPTYTTFTGPATRLEGQTVSYVLNGTNIPDGTQVGYTITGVDLSDISLSSLTGFITMNNFMGNQQAGQLQFSCLDDNNYEGSETMVVTLNNQDEAGNTTGLTPTLFIETIISDLATTTLPTFTCDDANFTVNTGVVDTGVSATSAGVPTLIVPAHYVLGVNSYTATITVPATDAWGTAYSNAGGSIECSAVGIGIAATTLATTTLPTFDCATAQLSIDNGVVGDGVVFENVGNATGLVPAQYVLGVNSYTATITVPATDANGNAYSNAGGSIECTAVGVGIAATTLATDATTNATAATTNATAAPLKGYYLHGGNQAYPFAQGEGLTANPTGTLYYDDGTNAYADTTDLSVAMTYLMNLGTITGAGGYTIQEFDIAAGGITSMGTSDALQFPASTQAEFYYVILPDTEVDLTSVSPQHLVNGGIETNAIQRMPFTWNSTGYYIYKIGGGSQSGALTITFSDND